MAKGSRMRSHRNEIPRQTLLKEVVLFSVAFSLCVTLSARSVPLPVQRPKCFGEKSSVARVVATGDRAVTREQCGGEAIKGVTGATLMARWHLVQCIKVSPRCLIVCAKGR